MKITDKSGKQSAAAKGENKNSIEENPRLQFSSTQNPNATTAVESGYSKGRAGTHIVHPKQSHQVLLL